MTCLVQVLSVLFNWRNALKNKDQCRCGKKKKSWLNWCSECYAEKIDKMKNYKPIAKEGGLAGKMSGSNGRVIRKPQSLA